MTNATRFSRFAEARPKLKYRSGWIVLAFAVSAAWGHALAQSNSPVGAAVPHRYIVVYREANLAGNAAATARVTGVSVLRQHQAMGMAVLQASSPGMEEASIAALRADPAVQYVLHDRVLSAHGLMLRPPLAATIGVTAGAPPAPAPSPSPAPTLAPYDTYYTANPQGWAVVQAGGFSGGTVGGPAHGPWDTTQGAGVRIAIVDNGVDRSHPDIAPNLAVSLSEIDQSTSTGLPSPCDDGSPQDQQGHGTWDASLAAAAMGPGTGLTIGVAPAATLINIKVLERMPDPSSTASDAATQCKTGQASGLLSWVIQGIQDAIAQHADVIDLSLGTLVDLETGEGAGLQAAFDRVTYAADQAGAVVIASAGNDGLDLSNPRYVELPAQSRSVLAVVASTNPGCAESFSLVPVCVPGAVTLPYYSNFGAPLDAIAAPGGSYPDGATPTPDTAVTGWVRGACSSGLPGTVDGPPTDAQHSFGCFNQGHTGYVEAMGTSASAALVSGAAALVRAAHPSWSPEDVISALRATAIPSAQLPAAPILHTQALVP
jgi:subtilisin family serine protease